MDLINVNEWSIPEGVVTKIVSAGKTLWEAVKWTVIYGESPSYNQSVPPEVRPDCKVNKIGGHSEVISGEIVSSQVDKLITRARNLWDEITENGYINGSGDYAPSPSQNPSLRSANFTECESNTLYSFIKPSTWSVNLNVAWYDENKSFISRVGKSGVIQEQISPVNARYFKLSLYNYGSTYKNDIASVKGSTTSGYTPYRQPQEIITGFPELRSAGNVYDYVDVTNGKLHRRIGTVDLGTLNWDYLSQSIYPNLFVTSGIDTISRPKMLSDRYSVVESTGWAGMTDKTIYKPNSMLGIRDDLYATPSAFKTAMNGVLLYYELAEEIVTDIDIPETLTKNLQVESGGVITFHNSYHLPVPNEVEYYIKEAE